MPRERLLPPRFGGLLERAGFGRKWLTDEEVVALVEVAEHASSAAYDFPALVRLREAVDHLAEVQIPAEQCVCGHPFTPDHQTPGTECSRPGCQCSRYRGGRVR